MPALGEDRLRVELDAVDRQFRVPDPHDDAALGAGRHLEFGGQRLGHDRQRVVPGRGERIRKSLQHTGIRVIHAAGLTVQQFGRPVHGGPEGHADGLVAEADTQQRGVRRGAGPHQVDRRAGALGGARAGAQQDAVDLGSGCCGVGQPGVVVTPHRRLDTQLAQVLHQVEDEAVVVVDDQDLHRPRLPVKSSR